MISSGYPWFRKIYYFFHFLQTSIFKLKSQINMKIFTFPTQRVQYVKLAGGEFLSELWLLFQIIIAGFLTLTNWSTAFLFCRPCKRFESPSVRDAFPFQNGWIFGKVPNGLGPPAPPHFRKVVLQIFSEIHDRSIVYNGKNLQYKFLDWKWPPPLPPLRNFSENSSVLEGGRLP